MRNSPDRARGSFAVNVRALDAIHVATAEVFRDEAGEPLEFWTHEERPAIAALSRGLSVRGTNTQGTSAEGSNKGSDEGSNGGS